MKSIRRCEIVSRIKKDNETLFDIENMKTVLSERACIKEYCYIIHDKDVYSEKEESQNPEHKTGTLKPAHIHLLLRFNTPQKLECIAKWFGIKNNFVNMIKGRFEDACLY